MRPVLDSRCFPGGGVRLLTSGYFFRASSRSAGGLDLQGPSHLFAAAISNVVLVHKLVRTRGFGWVVPRSWAGLGLST